MKSEPKWLSIGQAGVMKLDIPVYTIGSGNKPKLGIICSVHGDESAGLYIAARMINHLESSIALKGTVHIIPAANPAAQFVHSRVSPLDQKDLNRAGKGDEKGSYTERVGKRLFEFLSDCDLVVDIHEFEMHTPITAVLIDVGDDDVKKDTLAAINAFSPKIIWVINGSQSRDMQYQTTLDAALAQAGVVNFPIETTQLAFIEDTEIEEATQGLLRVAAHMGIIKPSPKKSTSHTPTFIRKETTADHSGLWEPNSATLMQSIEAGSQVGTLITLPKFEQKQVKSELTGVLVQWRHRQLVATGTSLFSIGDQADDKLKITFDK